MRFWRLSSKHVCIFTHTHIHTPRVSGLFLACLENSGRGRRGSGCAWVQGIANPHSFFGGRSRVLRESPHRFPVEKAEGRGFAWQPDMGGGQWGPWPRTPIPCKDWGSSPEGVSSNGELYRVIRSQPTLRWGTQAKGSGERVWHWDLQQSLKQLSGSQFCHLLNGWVELYMRMGYAGGKERQTPIGKWGQRGCFRAVHLAPRVWAPESACAFEIPSSPPSLFIFCTNTKRHSGPTWALQQAS